MKTVHSRNMQFLKCACKEEHYRAFFQCERIVCTTPPLSVQEHPYSKSCKVVWMEEPSLEEMLWPLA